MTTATEERTPLEVHCGKCNHEWSPVILPMEAGLVAKVLKAARCPSCGADHKALKMGPLPKPTGDGDYRAWLRNGDTGTSSETIWHVMTGETVRRCDIPWDPDDFGRCYRLLKVMPSWRARLPEVATRFPKWKPLVDAWDELTALYEDGQRTGWKPPYVMWERMKQLQGRGK